MRSAASCCSLGWAAGRGVTVWSVDSGVNADHQEFRRWDSGESRVEHG